MDANQPDGGILVMQKRKFPIVQEIVEPDFPDGSVSLEVPKATPDVCIPARCAYGGGTFVCSVYRSIRQLESTGRE